MFRTKTAGRPNRYRVRDTGVIVDETIESERMLRWLFEDPIGHVVMRAVVNHKPFHTFYGCLKDSARSRAEIPGFIARHGIDMQEAEREDPGSYRSFNDFFTRTLKAGARPFPDEPHRLGSPAEGKVLVYPTLGADMRMPVKGMSLGAAALLADAELARRFEGGAALVVRLAPYDYHRFHFPDDGTAGVPRLIPGEYLSVNPISLARYPDGFCRNTRAVTLIATRHFGEIAYVEVGATTVGTIVQTHQPGTPVARGGEKGYFRYGGSTVVLLFEPGRVVFDPDLVADSAAGLEVQVKAGSGIARAPGS